jgi:hypothetical protein
MPNSRASTHRVHDDVWDQSRDWGFDDRGSRPRGASRSAASEARTRSTARRLSGPQTPRTDTFELLRGAQDTAEEPPARVVSHRPSGRPDRPWGLDEPAAPVAERSALAERPARSSRAERAEPPARASRAERSASRTERASRSERPGRASRTERADRAERPLRSERADRTARAERTLREAPEPRPTRAERPASRTRTEHRDAEAAARYDELLDRYDAPESRYGGPGAYDAPDGPYEELLDRYDASEARYDDLVGEPIAAEPVAETSGGRRTVVITGRGSERYRPPVSRRPAPSVHDRVGFNPDRMALWAVLLGIVLLLVAAMSSHAAVLTHHVVAHAGTVPHAVAQLAHGR